MIAAIASGKGGTGKTTVAVNLARSARGAVALVDCDVEEPNAHLFIRGVRLDTVQVTTPVPEVDDALCNRCGLCAQVCRFNAIAPCPARTFVFAELCHGCGGCARVCPTGAITETGRPIGTIERFGAGNITLSHGTLDIGQAMAPPLIRALKAGISAGADTIIDSPPGTSCPMVAAVKGADTVALVTEPTPFGLHDLGLAVTTVRKLGLPFGVIINRSGTGDGRVRDYCLKQGIRVLLEIPDDRDIAESYSRGEVFSDTLPKYRAMFEDLWETLEEQAAQGRRRSET